MSTPICSIDERKHFVSDGVLDSARINKQNTETCYSCKEADIQPLLNKTMNVLSNDLQISQREKNELVMKIAIPYLEKIKKAIYESCMMVRLVDPNGYVLSITGNEKTLEESRHINFAVASHQWSCSVTPIFHTDGTLLGVIDVSCPLSKAHPLMLGAVATIAYAIEREIQILSYRKEAELIQHAVESNGTNQDRPLRVIFNGEIGTSEAFAHTMKQVKLVSTTDSTVHLSGETGTGKEIVARAIHDNSTREKGPFISLNCGAIPKNLLESELFGYVEGAFTGAMRKGYKGKFEQAQGGTILLDEIGEIPPAVQVALLRILQERKVVPIGGTKEIPLDIRIITATNRDLAVLVREGTLREDLYYRLHVYPINVPPLRERLEDIPYLVRFFCQKNQWSLPFLEEILLKLQDYHWPGNIRELMNVLECLHIKLSDRRWDKDEIVHEIELLLFNPAQCPTRGIEHSERNLSSREKVQIELMLEALHKTKGNVKAAATLLDIPRSTFYKRLKKWNL